MLKPTTAFAVHIEVISKPDGERTEALARAAIWIFTIEHFIRSTCRRRDSFLEKRRKMSLTFDRDPPS